MLTRCAMDPWKCTPLRGGRESRPTGVAAIFSMRVRIPTLSSDVKQKNITISSHCWDMKETTCG